MTIPASHIDEAQKLNAQGYAELYRMDFHGGSTVYLKTDHTEAWNGNVWEGVALKLTGAGQYGSDQVARPKLELQNPNGMFSPFVSEGVLDGALVTRFRVLYEDILANNPVYVSNVWQVTRVASLTKVSMALELRSFGDSPVFLIPSLTYSPPVFPVVSVR